MNDMCDLTHKISHIHKNIYISDIYNTCDINKLKKYNIKAILHLGDCNKSHIILQKYIDNGINNKFLKVKDTLKSDISKCFEESYEFMNFHANQKNNILIHCKKGISRSPSIVAYYLLRKMYEHKKKKINNRKNVTMKLISSRQSISNSSTKSILKYKQKPGIKFDDTEYLLDDILYLIQLERTCSKPNKHFIEQLKNYEDINIQTLINESK
jgi:protein-tyrosine phosphatase